MKREHWTVGELSRLARVTVRALHHYDEIDLLRPSAFTESGYRLYSRADLERLYLVRLYREAGLPLEEIRRILDAPDFDREAALRKHRQRLLARIEETHALIATLDQLIQPRGEDMGSKDLFNGFKPEDYEEEVKQRWGSTEAYRESKRRAQRYGEADWKKMGAESGEIEAELAACLAAGVSPDSERATDAAEAHRQHIERWFYPCDYEMHRGLGEMYVADERFTQHYERRAAGLAAYLKAAIDANAQRSALS